MEPYFLMHRVATVLLVLVSANLVFASDQQPASRPAISKDNRYKLIRLINAEYAWLRQSLPRSEKGVRIHPDGKIDPHGRDFQLELAKFGPIARAGERVQVTNVEVRDRAIYLELNGGAVKKQKWYQRIQVGSNGGMTNVSPQPDNTRALGTSITVEFNKHVPEMTVEELKQILSPLLDFSVKSAAQAYTESLPKNVQNAIKEHRVLVGMDREMVTYAKGRPPQRVREKDAEGKEYEEWIYGKPPQDVEFVRFYGDQVAQLKIMKVGGEKIVKTEPEVKLEGPALAKEQPAEEKPLPHPAKAPTLRRPGEPAAETDENRSSTPVPTPNPPSSNPPQQYQY